VAEYLRVFSHVGFFCALAEAFEFISLRPSVYEAGESRVCGYMHSRPFKPMTQPKHL
jgi:hypothetical protein